MKWILPLVGLCVFAGCQKNEPLDFNHLPHSYVTNHLGETAKVPVETEGDLAIFQGDIILGSTQDIARQNQLIESNSKSAVAIRFWGFWHNGVVPYVIDANCPSTKNIKAAIAQYHKHTNIRFVPRKRERSYVRFILDEKRNMSHIGKAGGEQKIHLTSYASVSTVVHEMGHAVGLHHEQTRWDRDKHIDIHWDNIEDEAKHNFKRTFLLSKDIGVYNFNSVMHYSAYAFSKNGKPTITRKNGSKLLGSRSAGLSYLDIRALKQLYK